MRIYEVTDFPDFLTIQKTNNKKSTNEIISQHLASKLHIGMSHDLITAFFKTQTMAPVINLAIYCHSGSQWKIKVCIACKKMISVDILCGSLRHF